MRFHKAYERGKPLVYLHIPKTSGSSLIEGMASLLQPDRIVSGSDRCVYGAFEGFHTMAAEMKVNLYLDIADLPEKADFIAGHFAFSTLAQKYAGNQLITFMREPKSRLLSFMLFWRSYSDEALVPWGDWGRIMRLSRIPLGQFLRLPEVACHTDNIVTRLLLWPNELIPGDGFIDERYDSILLQQAIDRLGHFSYVDVIENPKFVELLSQWFSEPIKYGLVNETRAAALAVQVPLYEEFSETAVEALAARTRIDRRLWNYVAELTVNSPAPVVLCEQTILRNVARFSMLTDRN